MSDDNQKSFRDRTYYEILGIPMDVTLYQDDLKVYCKAALKTHPDRKGGDPVKYRELMEAYEVLSHPQKRTMYDRYGQAAFKGESRCRCFDNKYNVFGIRCHCGYRRFHRRIRGEDLIHPLDVSLENLYNGRSKKFSLKRNLICFGCEGKGTKRGAPKCDACLGSGKTDYLEQLDACRTLRMQRDCDDCKGIGEKINDENRCPQCKGERVVQETKVLKVIVHKGMQDGQKIVFAGQADEDPETYLAGDVVFILQEKVHPIFKRKGDDLYVEHTLSQTEALCGFKFVLTHLDGRQLLIESQPGEVYRHDQFKVIDDEGMPIYSRYSKTSKRGKLYIHISVDSPDSSVTLEQAKAVDAVLPTTMQISDMKLNESEDIPDPVNAKERRRMEQQQAQEAYEDSEDMQGRP